jgi:hypothetical protein
MKSRDVPIVLSWRGYNERPQAIVPTGSRPRGMRVKTEAGSHSPTGFRPRLGRYITGNVGGIPANGRMENENRRYRHQQVGKCHRWLRRAT